MDYKRISDSGYEGQGTPDDGIPSREYISSVCDRLRAAVSGAGSYASPLGQPGRSGFGQESDLKLIMEV